MNGSAEESLRRSLARCNAEVADAQRAVDRHVKQLTRAHERLTATKRYRDELAADVARLFPHGCNAMEACS